MINKLLIANRGEIACRVIRTARKLGISTVAVYSSADANALHVSMADEAVHIGPAPSKESYLKGEVILKHAKALNVDAIHPGYGFLSENAKFARACDEAGIIFIGPPEQAIAAMGSKSAAKNIMQDAGVPLVPGYHGDEQSSETLKHHANDMGYPVLLKAAAGGGGKGMRQVWSEDEFDDALNAAKREAMASFSDDIMLIEKYLTQPRHVEIQVFCDTQGNGVYLFERDCSVQRRHQKIIEEAPAPGISDDLRQNMGEAALKAAHAINYVGAGTVEFLLDADGRFYFMEMNTRLQVEHPVTEKITGEDLVEWQITVADGQPLPKGQADLKLTGHAFEARLYAEDPQHDFLPATGNLKLLRPPAESEHIRVDTGVVQGDEVSVYYDPMIAKLIVWDTNREKALQRLLSALRDYHVAGVTTNLSFLYNVASHPAFRKAELVTTFIETHHDSLFNQPGQNDDSLVPAAALLILLTQEKRDPSENIRSTPWDIPLAWRANHQLRQKLELVINQQTYELTVTHTGSTEKPNQWQVEHQDKVYNLTGHLEAHTLHAHVDGYQQRIGFSQDAAHYTLFSADGTIDVHYVAPDLGETDDAGAHSDFAAPMNGTVVDTMVSTGEKVKKGTTLIVMEAMKMEHAIKAPADGVVTEFFFAGGDLVDGGAQLLEFKIDE
ncbi:acetyl-CoA carboxylase biotin carboxylase subunit [Alteromonas lipotrueiana]|uniref:acetyl-CoA carboxylase biotin carboxylase subunit n=1 Tax=Alteromonas lipotrueiana TaxID=2803815 RepID=UPI001C4580FF|nr:acetyl/propionyl/methylcrotonyl-CoA carboxylase subunit alpha [Alteromonas lipotrueiana]